MTRRGFMCAAVACFVAAACSVPASFAVTLTLHGAGFDPVFSLAVGLACIGAGAGILCAGFAMLDRRFNLATSRAMRNASRRAAYGSHE